MVKNPLAICRDQMVDITLRTDPHWDHILQQSIRDGTTGVYNSPVRGDFPADPHGMLPLLFKAWLPKRQMQFYGWPLHINAQ